MFHTREWYYLTFIFMNDLPYNILSVYVFLIDNTRFKTGRDRGGELSIQYGNRGSFSLTLT